MKQDYLSQDMLKIIEIFTLMDIKDQCMFILATEEYAEIVHKLVEKYDVTKPMTFELRRTDL